MNWGAFVSIILGICSFGAHAAVLILLILLGTANKLRFSRDCFTLPNFWLLIVPLCAFKVAINLVKLKLGDLAGLALKDSFTIHAMNLLLELSLSPTFHPVKIAAQFFVHTEGLALLSELLTIDQYFATSISRVLLAWYDRQTHKFIASFERKIGRFTLLLAVKDKCTSVNFLFFTNLLFFNKQALLVSLFIHERISVPI